MKEQKAKEKVKTGESVVTGKVESRGTLRTMKSCEPPWHAGK